MDQLRNSAAGQVWEQFLAICSIPHPSNHEERICEFIIEFAKERGLKWEQDDIGNVVVTKPATQGNEHVPGIILQSHVDMVPEKNSDSSHDFLNDPIQTLIEGEWLTAKGTTLGADNGVGAAAALAVLASNEMVHGSIEALFTVVEEKGMIGARNLASDMLTGTVMLNTDTEEEGELFIGCAGGIRIYTKGEYEQEQAADTDHFFKLSLTGLLGGHSGTDIHLGRANAIQVMAGVIQSLADNGVRLSQFDGGGRVNVIPREAEAIIAIPQEKKTVVAGLIDSVSSQLKSEYPQEENLTLALVEMDERSSVLPVELQTRWIDALSNCPLGVQKMSTVVEGVVETSCNLGVAKITEGTIWIENMPRSLVDQECLATAEKIKTLFISLGAESWDENGYPGWQPNPASLALAKVKATYEMLFDKSPALKVVHAGLECGLLSKAYPEWDIVSFGPTITGAHSPDERVHIASVDRFWQLLTHSIEAFTQ